jgi:inner membrane protein
MDPLTQGTLGASLPQACLDRRHAASAGLLGFLAGMAADLDVLIRSSTDPLLFLEYHRQFTHSLIFIPVGGLLCALLLHQLFGRRRGLSFRQSWLFCTLGYATHALLDACTTYGTMLLWPFSDQRFAWNTISIIDPLFTLPLLLGVVMTARKKRHLYVRLALLWAFSYMVLGLWQRNTAVDMGYALAAERGHEPLRLEAKPSFANILVWKIVYETGDRYYVDAVRARVAPRVFPGDSVEKLNIARDMPWLDLASQQARDIERFRWFSNGYIARDPIYRNRVIDIRYSLIPNEVDPLWSIELRPGAAREEHAAYRVHRDTGGNRIGTMWGMVTGSQASRPAAASFSP